MRLNNLTKHAIRIMLACAASDGSRLKVSELSKSLGLTMQNTFKMVHFLVNAELLIAVRGRNGGVQLARKAETIMIGDIVRAI